MRLRIGRPILHRLVQLISAQITSILTVTAYRDVCNQYLTLFLSSMLYVPILMRKLGDYLKGRNSVDTTNSMKEKSNEDSNSAGSNAFMKDGIEPGI